MRSIDVLFWMSLLHTSVFARLCHEVVGNRRMFNTSTKAWADWVKETTLVCGFAREGGLHGTVVFAAVGSSA